MLSISSLGIPRTSASPASVSQSRYRVEASPSPLIRSASRAVRLDPPEDFLFATASSTLTLPGGSDASPFLSRLNRLARTPAGDEWRVLHTTGAGGAAGGVALARGEGENSETFSLAPSLPAAFAGAVCASVGDWGRSAGLLLLHCAAGIAVIELPPPHVVVSGSSGRGDGEIGTGGVLPCTLRTARVGATLLAAVPPTDARWHPLSDRHFVTLSGDALRTWDADAALRGLPALVGELLLPPGVMGLGGGTALCMGAGGGVWDALTAYLLTADGRVFSLCPILPTGAALSAAAVAALFASSSTLSSSRTTTTSRDAKATLLWLNSYLIPALPSGDYHIHSPPSDHAFPFSPKLQGPLSISPIAAMRAGESYFIDIAAAPSVSGAHRALSLLRADGRLVLLVAAAPAVPAWGVPSGAGDAALQTARRLAAITLVGNTNEINITNKGPKVNPPVFCLVAPPSGDIETAIEDSWLFAGGLDLPLGANLVVSAADAAERGAATYAGGLAGGGGEG